MFNFFKGENNKNPEKPKSDMRILPSDVRYALQYKEALLNKDEIKDLNINNFQNEALYMTIKGLQGSPEDQKLLIEKYVSYVLNNIDKPNKDKNVLKKIIEESLKGIGTGLVKGAKLAQVSRQGFDFWQNKFEEKAQELSTDKRKVFLVANAMILGLGSFVEHFSKTGKPLNIIIPKWMDEGAHVIGYTIGFENKKATVDFLLKKSDKDQALAVLVDDATNSGKVFSQIKDYWIKNGLKEPDTTAIANLKGNI